MLLILELVKCWDNNLVLVFELDVMVFKMKVSVEVDNVGFIIDLIVIDGLSNFNGVILNGFIGNVFSGVFVILFVFSDDGVIYGFELIIIMIDLVVNGLFKCFVNLLIGVVKGVY